MGVIFRRDHRDRLAAFLQLLRDTDTPHLSVRDRNRAIRSHARVYSAACQLSSKRTAS